MTIVALALEAGVPRNALTQRRHTDLKNEFYDKVRARGGTPDSEQRLRKQIRRLKGLGAADAEEIVQLKTDVEALIGTLHQATVESQLLHQQQAERTAVLRPSPYSIGLGPSPHREVGKVRRGGAAGPPRGSAIREGRGARRSDTPWT
ncbi:hypothetical protein [Streptomyces coffeae]|uniref:Uncharacterized protein n=1 Tax=Streptomyces coffeae TaxID=621382 RepID=A0ABS1N7M6_9ACTN|nr:hypothetical protein [Streptomyces coffeae]MBL1095939.1 hypothetical protein [Streptomyces coffeae]